MKAQLTYWADVLGCPTKALYWMHGVDNTFHGFVELSGDSYIAFVQHPDNPSDDRVRRHTCGQPGRPVTGGATQHIAMHVDTLDEVLAIRDRIRSHGVQVMGPIDHGMIQSIYFAGPEGLNLEVCCGSDIDENQWIDPEVQGLCGISAEEVERPHASRPDRGRRVPGATTGNRSVATADVVPARGLRGDHGRVGCRHLEQRERDHPTGAAARLSVTSERSGCRHRAGSCHRSASGSRSSPPRAGRIRRVGRAVVGTLHPS